MEATNTLQIQLIPRQERILKVAAYCRVSTAKAQQHESFETQCRYYTRLIDSNPKWAFVGIYADEGLSATTTAHRKEFNRMMQDARDGKIDLILVKSISRFSRNAVDCNEAVHELKTLQVEVRFEKEGISTFDPTADFLFNINAVVAQEVSHSISKSVQWRVQKDFEKGKHHLGNNRVRGYDVVDRQLIGNMSPAMDMRYDNIPDQMFDDAITRAKTDLSRTELAFLVHTFDRKTGAHHTLAYDAQTEL